MHELSQDSGDNLLYSDCFNWFPIEPSAKINISTGWSHTVYRSSRLHENATSWQHCRLYEISQKLVFIAMLQAVYLLSHTTNNLLSERLNISLTSWGRIKCTRWWFFWKPYIYVTCIKASENCSSWSYFNFNSNENRVPAHLHAEIACCYISLL